MKTKKGDDDGHEAYIHKVRDETNRYLHELLDENERLRSILAALEAQRDSMVERIRVLEEEAAKHGDEQQRAVRRFAEMEAENRRFSEDVVTVEQQNTNLAHLYVATYRLHGTLVRGEVLAAMEEIVVNLIGSEEFGVFEVDSGTLSLVASMGIDSDRYRAVRVGDGAIGRVAASGEPFVVAAEQGASGDRLTACIPLKVDGAVIGVIAIFRLLQQKPALEPLDRELLDLLATHAATALYSTTLEGRLRRAGAPAA